MPSGPHGRTWEGELLRLYRGLLFLYPAEFRHEYGRELCLAVADRWREERTPAGWLRCAWEAVSGVFHEAPKEHYHMIVQDLRYALRILRKDATVTAAAIAILALGIGSTTLVFSLANGLLLRPLPYPHPEGIVAIEEYSPTDSRSVSFPNYVDIRARARLLVGLGVYTSEPVTVLGGDAAERIPAAQMSDGVWRVLGVPPLTGRTFTRADDQPHGAKVAVISEELWRGRYGRDPRALGGQLDTGNVRYTIVGVMPAGFHFPDRAQLWFPLQLDPAQEPRTDYFLHAVGRLKPGVSLAQASAELQALLAGIHREHPEADNGKRARAKPLRDFLAGNFRTATVSLLGAVGLLLLIACANVSNLLLVKVAGRLREIALRTALGATRRRIVRQLVSESLLLGLSGGLLGVALALVGVPALLSLIPIDLPRWLVFSPDRRVLGFALLVSVASSLAFGLAPVFGSFSPDLTRALKEGGHVAGGRRQKFLRHGLVIAELALAVTLLTGAGLMMRSFLNLRAQDLGYRPERVLSQLISYPGKRYAPGAARRALLDRLGHEVAALPGVEAVAFASGVPLADSWDRIVTIEGRPLPLADMPAVNHVVATPGYFRTLGIPLLRGRDFAPGDYDGRLVVVSESFVEQHWRRENPLGKRIRFGPPAAQEPWHTVIGVVANSRQGQIKGIDNPNVYIPYNRETTPNSLLVRTAADPPRLAAAVKARIATVDRAIAVSQVASLEQIVGRRSWKDRFFTFLFAAFAALALVMAAVGLYATLSYTVSLQIHEIGIRMALGASAARVRLMVMRQGLALAVTGLAVGLLTALALARLLASQLYQVSPRDPAAYLAAPALLLAVALWAAFLPTRRATRVDPVIALRHE